MNYLKMLTVAVLLSAGFATHAQDIVAEREIDLDGAVLAEEMRRPDRDTTDTAVIASNSGDKAALVVCNAANANGRVLGRAAMRVPAGGLRFLRASDIANGADYVGQVRCKSRSAHVTGSAILVAPSGFTSLRVRQRYVDGVLHIQAPVTASF